MVLRALLLLLLACPACIKPDPAGPARTPVKVAVALLHQSVDGTPVEIPRSYRDAISSSLERRGITPVFVASEALRSKRTSSARVRGLLQQTAGVEFALLVETRSSFYSELEGRFRWTVAAATSLAKRGSSAAPAKFEFSAPAILNFPHESDPETLSYAANPLAREVAAQTIGYIDDNSGAEPQATLPRAESIYFVMVDRFANGDRSNDEKVDPTDANAWHGGDLRGLIDHLDYIADLGVRTVWLSPLFASRREKFHGHGAFHGYWPRDLAALDPHFGTLEELAELRDALHARGMDLVLDVVLNHVGYDTPLVKAKPEWFHKNGAISDWNDPRQLTDFDVHGLPDLAQERRDVFAYLVDTAAQWRKWAQPSGFRLDAVKHVPAQFWSRFSREMKRNSEKPLLLIGELYDGDPARLAESLRNDGFDRVFDFPLHFSLIDVFCRAHSPTGLAAVLSLDRLYDDPTKLVTFADNHDVSRLASACGGDSRSIDSALRFLLSARGVPSLTYGTEAGLAGAKEPENRGDMKFERTPRFALIQRMLMARARFASLTSGVYAPIVVDSETFVYARILGDEATLVGYHSGNQPRIVDLPDWIAGENLFSEPKPETETGDFVLEPRQTSVRVVRPAAVSKLTRWAQRMRSPELVQVTFDLAENLSNATLGELSVGGGGPELGHWNPERALRFDNGSTSVRVPFGTTLQFKLRRRIDGGGDWESGDNRILHVTGDREVRLAWRE